MNKTLFSLLFLIFLTFFALPNASRAAISNDFMALRVPDLSQAESFFQNVMSCENIKGGIGHYATSALLDCGNGAILELSTTPPDQHASSSSSQPPATVMSFTTPDAGSTMRWLRRNGIAIAGHPLTVTEGGGLEKTIIKFVAPWGQPLQLVSYSKASKTPELDDAAAVQLASP